MRGKANSERNGTENVSKSHALCPLPIWIIYLKPQRNHHSFEKINTFVCDCKEAYRKFFSIEILKEGFEKR